MTNPPVTPRLRAWVNEHFGDEAQFVLAQLAAYETEPTRQSSERLLAAVAIVADRRDLAAALELARTDWRDVLVEAGLGHQNWPSVLDDVLGVT